MPVEIISADSRQVIRRLEIGTAKPTPEEQQQAVFHLIDIINPGERYSAFQFLEDSDRLIGEILKRDRLPVVVGGTGLYLRALTEGVVEIDIKDMSIRERLEKQYDTEGPDSFHAELTRIDPLEAAKIHPHNKHHMIRALEIFYLSQLCWKLVI